MTTAAGSAPDPFFMQEPNDPTIKVGWRSYDGRTQVNPLTGIGGTKRANIVAFGQSNGGGNYGIVSPGYALLNPSAVFNLNPYNGAIYAGATAPTLGAGGDGEGWLNRYADKLIATGLFDRVVLCGASISSTFVADWATGGYMNGRIRSVANRLTALGMSASGVIFMHGESDNVGGTSQAAYAASLATVISTIQAQAAFSGVPIFISQTSYYTGTTSAAVRAAQIAATNGATIFNLGDSDTIGAGGRTLDNIHLDASGQNSWATIATTNSSTHLTVR